jgi:hypothetical protein
MNWPKCSRPNKVNQKIGTTWPDLESFSQEQIQLATELNPSQSIIHILLYPTSVYYSCLVWFPLGFVNLFQSSSVHCANCLYFEKLDFGNIFRKHNKARRSQTLETCYVDFSLNNKHQRKCQRKFLLNCEMIFGMTHNIIFLNETLKQNEVSVMPMSKERTTNIVLIFQSWGAVGKNRQ